MKKQILALSILAVLAFAGCGNISSSTPSTRPATESVYGVWDAIDAGGMQTYILNNDGTCGRRTEWNEASLPPGEVRLCASVGTYSRIGDKFYFELKHSDCGGKQDTFNLIRILKIEDGKLVMYMEDGKPTNLVLTRRN